MTTARRTCLILLIVSLVLVGRQLTRARSPAPTAPDSSGQAPGAIASEHDPGPAPSGATPRAEPSLGEGELGRALGGLEHFAGAVPRDTFDPAAVAALTGADVDAVFTWVRDQTTLVAYRGALRGPSGVLMDGLGNSLDRALLLQELLRQHGHEVRLARVELTAGQARDLFDRTPAVLAVPPPSSFQALPTTNVEREAEALGIDRAALREGLSRLTEQARFLQEQLVARTEQQASTILATVPPPANDLELERAAQQETLRDHWWVQVLADGKWLDLDPSLPDAVPGRTIATAAETPTIQTLADMPAALRHTVQLRLILECRGALV